MSLTRESPADRVARFARHLDIESFTPMVGDASNRAYFRLRLTDGQSRVLALMPHAFTPEELPFLNVAELFRAMPLRVPRIYSVAGADGILVLEDLGDDLLQDAVERAEIDKDGLYREAIHMLATLQLRGRELDSDRYLSFRIAFDEAKFVQELDFFREHFVEGLRSSALGSTERDELDGVFQELAGELTHEPMVLCHRDYHARNLMVVGDELVLIDFQDCRRGPAAYDLASLLNDSYVPHDAEFRGAMTALFENAVGATVSKHYDVAALQRNLKALGTFGYQISSRGNTVYERYVGPTLELLHDNFERNPRFDALRRILARHVKEIG